MQEHRCFSFFCSLGVRVLSAETSCTNSGGCTTKSLLESPSELWLLFGGCSGTAQSCTGAGSPGQAGLAQLALGGVFALGSPGFQQL